MSKIYLYLRNTEFEKDEFKRKLKFIPYLMLIEDSTDMEFLINSLLVNK